MWQSEDDVLKDLASLNDFGNPEDKESYRILYSVGRGLKTKEKPRIPDTFIDSRTGETVSSDKGLLDTDDTYYKSKGRGSLLGSFFRTKVQLQQQLRLARPLGSSDEAIESYYGRSRSEEIQSSTNTLDSELATQSTRITPGRLNNEIKKRVKATRNSGSQVNALINSLLSKHKIKSDITTKENSTSNIRDEKLHFRNAEKYDRDDNIGNREKNALNDRNFSDLAASIGYNEGISASEKNVNYFKESTSTVLSKKHIGLENLKIIDGDEKVEGKEQQKKERANNDGQKIEKESENFRDLKYTALGKRLKKLREPYSSTPTNEKNESASLSGLSVHTESVIINEKDFPPLPIKDTLENDGTLGKFKAEMRTKVMDILSGQVVVEKPHLSNEMLLLNELIREYLTWNGYKYTKSVFIQECGLNNEPLPRSLLLEDLGVCDSEDSSKFSVLYGIITGFKEDNKRTSDVDSNKD